MTRIVRILLLALPATVAALSQTEPHQLVDVLKEGILKPEVADFQLRQHIVDRVAQLPAPGTGTEWTRASKALRRKLLDEVVFHGWPKEWVASGPKFEEVGTEQGNGYRMRKLRYEIIPGFQSVAILYEPLTVNAKIPAILNVNGHVGAPGKSVEYKQKRCITFARNGILALNLEWLGCGELSSVENDHWYGAHLDLAGANELGLFYLAMRRGLDYLYDHPNTDRTRVGMTGLSGGGWQTIVLSSLDERVTAAAPVAGFSSILPRAEAKRYGDMGDVEQSATDLFDGRDYSWLAAMMAPRPTLLAYNAEDDCCFRSGMVKPLVYDAVRPFFALFDREQNLSWHENRDPGTHNYQLDNRMAAYEFFSRHFRLPPIKEDPGIGAEIRSYDDLKVGLPTDNLTVLGLARKLAETVKRVPAASDAPARDAERRIVRDVVRYRPAKLERTWTTLTTKRFGVETKAQLFTMSDGLTSNAIWLKPIGAPETAPASIVLDDRGKGAMAPVVSDRLNRGETVLALDLPFHGDAWTKGETWALEQMLHTMGERALGIEAAHLIALAETLKTGGAPTVRLESNGIRTQVVALVAAALRPDLFSEVNVRAGMSSLRHLLNKPVKYSDAADLFCLDLFKTTDLDRLAALAAPAVVRTDVAE